MKPLSLDKKLLFSLIFSFFFTTLLSEDSVDIWKKENLNKKNNVNEAKDLSLEKPLSKINIKADSPKEIEVNSFSKRKAFA